MNGKETPLISVIIPAYNCENTINNCINSILSQLTDGIQIIVIDDGSTDKTYELTKKKAIENQELELVRQTNKGPSAARNKGIELAKGKYLCFVDSDDIILPNMFNTLVRYQKEDNADLVISGIRKVIKQKKKNMAINLNVESKKIYFSKEDIRKHLIEMMQMGINSPVGRLYKTDVIKENNIYFYEDLDMAEDLHFNLNYIEKIDRVLFIPDIFYQYNTYYSNLTFKYRENLFYSREKSIQILKAFLERNKMETEIIYYFYIKLIYAASMQEIEHRSNRKKRLGIIKENLDNERVREAIEKYQCKTLTESIIYWIVKLQLPCIIDFVSMIFVKIRKNGRFFTNRLSV